MNKTKYMESLREMSDEELVAEYKLNIKQQKPGYNIRCLAVQTVQQEHLMHLTR